MQKHKLSWTQSKFIKKVEKAQQAITGLSDIQLALEFSKLRTYGKQSAAALQAQKVAAFACVREAMHRKLKILAYPVQLAGALALTNGQVAEMSTGEGKTFVVAFAAAWAALDGPGVHVVTANEYLAERDQRLLDPVYRLLGLSSSVTLNGMSGADKKAAYSAKICYGTHAEFGFDYLRDNIALSLSQKVQGERYFAIVDEADLILIDDARTPLVISGSYPENPGPVRLANDIAVRLLAELPGGVTPDYKKFTISISEDGYALAEQLFLAEGVLKNREHLYDSESAGLLAQLEAALKAHLLYVKGRDYLVKNDKIVIVDEATGRLQEDRRWGDGVHLALEAKELVTLQDETRVLATISYQHYFRGYKKLAGLTGTAWTSREELFSAYGLDVVRIPTNRPCIRTDQKDVIFATEAEKLRAVVDSVRTRHSHGQPVLIGTASVESSERVSALLQAAGIRHTVLSAKNPRAEAELIANAGLPGAVTVATNMAGRGTDIHLGGENGEHRDAVLTAGGLCVLGTERHHSRRVDNQLIGRSGRQGDPGESKFFLSLDDYLLKHFSAPALAHILKDGGVESPLVDKFVFKAQRKVEAMHAEARKQLLQFDTVLAAQRSAFYAWRDELLGDETSGIELINTEVSGLIRGIVHSALRPDTTLEDTVSDVVAAEVERLLPLSPTKLPALPEHIDKIAEAREWAEAQVTGVVAQRLAVWDGYDVEARNLYISVIDRCWQEHLTHLESVKDGIHLRSYAQLDPFKEYAKEAGSLFAVMRAEARLIIADKLLTTAPTLWSEEELPEAPEPAEPVAPSVISKPAKSLPATEYAQPLFNLRIRERAALSRTAQCPCGSGKRYKHCHGNFFALG